VYTLTSQPFICQELTKYLSVYIYYVCLRLQGISVLQNMRYPPDKSYLSEYISVYTFVSKKSFSISLILLDIFIALRSINRLA